MFAWALFKQYFPPQLRAYIEGYAHKAIGHAYPYIQITFPEISGERLERCEAYSAIQNYLSASASARATRLKAESVKDSKSLVLSMDENEEVVDEFEGVKVWWSSSVAVSRSSMFSLQPPPEDRRLYRLTFHRSHRELITGSYITYVLVKGKAVAAENRQRKLFTNNPSSNWYYYKASKWSHVAFEHPATFDTLAMEPNKKSEIMNDLLRFRRGKEYYERIGKAWKRGYLLYGPPGTGKSTMIAAMANFLNYDVYDLELTTVKDNTELRKLLIETSAKSIIVIEDIDCSLDLTGQRKTKKREKDDDEEKADPVKRMAKGGEESKDSKPNQWVIASASRLYRLTFHRSHRELITGSYITYVLVKGKAVAAENRQRKLFTNNPSSNWYYYKASKWSHVAFEHPATFDTLAMEPNKKSEIMNDLLRFRRGKEYYERIGKAWKRGYLLYGPPGTGKSTMIAAMANFLNYDVYDLELTTVKDNTELRKLLIETSAKSIIVIEDIDCSLDLTGQRKTKKQEKDEDEEKADPVKRMVKGGDESKDSKVTLSGLLNFIDGLWSACGGERIIVFTTNYVEKLDPALIRRGRMDKHIEMSYCCYESFKVLVRNYLDVESHPLFATVRRLLEETKMTPADVAENLMPKSDDEDEEACLEGFIEALEKRKRTPGRNQKKKKKKKQQQQEKQKQQQLEQ
ncbi:hypothetical protein EUGRSUZ_J02147 [Eucalyptus grandis]|uniref:Uncharacterized protein n=1 Tax=Eucalyptus grandis TaxID=71139 RepID=A0ACC3J8Z2_EUCGR|nr:hypothetical protein EUGRSUZ_J02147 [Eucalyptus grandis]